MGELHLEVFLERIRRENNMKINSTPPSVSYKESIYKSCVGSEGKYIRQSGGRGQYGHVIINVEPRKNGKKNLFINKIKGGAIPKEYIASVEKGIFEASKKGTIYGFQIVGVKITLCDGSYHEVDSSENAFKIAAAMALKKAIKASQPYVLEPIMEVTIETPKDYIGKIIGNIISKRGEVLNNTDKGFNVIKALIPLNEMFKYSTILRSLSQGRATYTMKFFKYKKLNENLYEKI